MKKYRKITTNNHFIITSYYNKKNKLHRTNGPAVIKESKGGSYKIVEYWRNGKKYTNSNNQFSITYLNDRIKEYEYIYGDKTIEVRFNNKNFKLQSIFYYKNGVSHRDNKPAYIQYNDNGNIDVEAYFIHGKLHRLDGPAFISYYENKKIMKKSYYVNGLCHREDGPAEIYYHEDGKLYLEKYYKNGELHREDGPALIEYHDNGKKFLEKYYNNNELHRLDGPAVIEYYGDGSIYLKEYYKNNELHRENGPAEIQYLYNNKNLDLVIKRYYLHNDECNELQELVIKGVEMNEKANSNINSRSKIGIFKRLWRKA